MSKRPHKWRDVAWKWAIVDGAREAIDYFMPDLASYMDTSKDITGITGMELPMQASDSDKGMRVSDIFLSIPVVGGEDWNTACVVEQQHENDKDFAARMFDSWVRLRAQRSTGRTTGFALYTGNSKDVKFYTESCYGLEASLKFRTFHLPSYNIEELRKDKRPFARVMYAGRLSLESENDVTLREKHAWEILNTTSDQEYDKKQRKFILEFANRIFWLSDPQISHEVREAYKMKTIPLSEYAQAIAKEEGIIEGMERGMEKGMERGMEKGMERGKVEVARKMLARRMPVSEIVDITGLNERDILSIQ
jgi:predicted transposase YdaD